MIAELESIIIPQDTAPPLAAPNSRLTDLTRLNTNIDRFDR
jgi:hypothetical protein